MHGCPNIAAPAHWRYDGAAMRFAPMDIDMKRSRSPARLRARIACTTVEVSRLAREGALIEVEAIAVLPPR
jgi:enamine deaminase RidA (YjgF/YER057c/UK114 family)